MKKMKLELEQLAVDSFSAEGPRDRRGTVYAESTRVGSCQYPSRSCAPGETEGEFSCYCMYHNTDERVCCSDAGCSGGGMC
jgi:hypothetical protein